MWVTKLLISPVKKRTFLPQNDQIYPKIGIFCQFGPGHAGFFGALLVGRLVVVSRGLYLARHLFTLFMFLCQVTILHPPSVTLDQSYQHRSGGSILELVCSVKVGIIVIEIKKDPLPPLQPPSTPPKNECFYGRRPKLETPPTHPLLFGFKMSLSCCQFCIFFGNHSVKNGQI